MMTVIFLLAFLFIVLNIYIIWSRSGRSTLISSQQPILLPKSVGYGITLNPNHPLGIIFYGILLIIILIGFIWSING
jgi:hypothetical protein